MAYNPPLCFTYYTRTAPLRYASLISSNTCLRFAAIVFSVRHTQHASTAAALSQLQKLDRSSQLFTPSSSCSTAFQSAHTLPATHRRSLSLPASCASSPPCAHARAFRFAPDVLWAALFIWECLMWLHCRC